MAKKRDGGLGPEAGASDDGEAESAEVPPGTATTVDLPFPGYVATAFYRLPQTSWPRRWCLRMITWPYPCCTGREICYDTFVGAALVS